MAINIEDLRRHFASLSDEALLGVDRADLTSVAQKCVDAEIASRRLRWGAEEKEAAAALSFTDPEHEPDWLETAFPASVFSGASSSGALDAVAARNALLAAGIPCEVSEHMVEPEEPAPPVATREYRVMVPAALILQATSILDVAIFNGELEAEWKTQLESLNDEELRALNVESLCAGLLDRVERLRKIYKQERQRREL